MTVLSGELDEVMWGMISMKTKTLNKTWDDMNTMNDSAFTRQSKHRQVCTTMV